VRALRSRLRRLYFQAGNFLFSPQVSALLSAPYPFLPTPTHCSDPRPPTATLIACYSFLLSLFFAGKSPSPFWHVVPPKDFPGAPHLEPESWSPCPCIPVAIFLWYVCDFSAFEPDMDLFPVLPVRFLLLRFIIGCDVGFSSFLSLPILWVGFFFFFL